MIDAPGHRAWRCQSCRALLGIERGAELHVKFKDVQYWISGRCRHPCRRCGATNTFHAAAGANKERA